MSVFVKSAAEYQRENSPIQYALEDLTTALMVSENIPFEEAKEYVERTISPNGAFPLKNPTVSFLKRGKNGDRTMEELGLIEYLDLIKDNDYILSPSMTAYERPEVRRSILAEYIQINLGLRTEMKSKMFVYNMRGDNKQYMYYKSGQEFQKIKNNSLSGLQSSPSTPGYNPTAHSALTSLCRCATSFANSNQEKFIGGLRHYYAPTVVYNHLILSIRKIDAKKAVETIDRLGLKYPTVDDVMECVIHSTQYYWRDESVMSDIRGFVESMSPVHRAAFVYVGDPYHVKKHNRDFMAQFLAELGYRATVPAENPKDIISKLDDNYKAIATLLCSDVMAGITLKDAEKERPEAYALVAATAQNMLDTVSKYEDFIGCFIVQNYLPVSIYAFPTSYRKSVPTSDTDSSIFTLQDWCDDLGDGEYTPKTMSVMFSMVFLISAVTANTLAMYSANMGVEEKYRFEIEMKNEYIFPVYVLTMLVKHYYAYIMAQEGNVFGKLKVERKGVNLRSSNSPKMVNDKAGEFMTTLMDVVMQGKKWSIKEALRFVYEIEKAIYDDVLSGAGNMLNTVTVNQAISYTAGENNSTYKSYEFWNKYFSKKYGDAPEPPYRAIKVNVELPNKTAVQRWINSIEDPYIREGMREWVESEGKKDVSLFRIPTNNAQAHGIPKEILQVVDIRGLIRQVTKPLYLVLESMGIHLINKRATRIVLDDYNQ